MDVAKYRELFVEEASKNLQEMGDCLERLSSSGGDGSEIDVLFRHAHSIKGMASSMAYDSISQVSHKTEDLMDKIRSGKREFTTEIIQILFEVVDFLQSMVDVAASGEQDFPDVSSLTAKILEAGKVESEQVQAPIPPSGTKGNPEEPFPESLQAFQDQGKKIFKIRLIISKDSPVPAARAFLVLLELEKIGDIQKLNPSRQEIENGEIGKENEVALFLVTDSEKADAEKVFKSAVELESFEIVEVVIKTSERLEKEKGIFVREEGKKNTPAITLPAYRKPTSVKVDTPDLDNMIDIIGEMMIQESRLDEFLHRHESPELKSCHVELLRSIKGIQRHVMKFRTMPLSSLVDMLPRVARELQRSAGKEVELSIEGKDVKLDRAVLEELGDPLLHLVRNSIDHGLETPEERQKLGKEPAGKLCVSAWQGKELIYIRIEDDGRGIDAQKAKEKAIEKGLLSREKADKLSEEEALDLICMPGLSTAKEVTSISGRGVGMDVVKTAIKNLGGNLLIQSTPGEGTRFTLKIPMSLAIVKTFLVRLGELLIAIPLTKLLFVAEVPTSEFKEEEGNRFFLRKEERISLVSLGSLLQFSASSPNGKELESIIGVDMANKKVGLVVDSLLNSVEAVIKPVGTPLANLGYYSGVIVTGKGEMALVLDVEKFAEKVK